jgi:hypothetical protein
MKYVVRTDSSMKPRIFGEILLVCSSPDKKHIPAPDTVKNRPLERK